MKNILIITTLLWLLNYKFFLSLFTTVSSSYAVLYEIIVYFIILLFLLTLFSWNKIANAIFINILLVISVIGLYFINTMGIVIDGNMLNNVLSTDSSEALELLDINFYIYTLVCFVLLYLLNLKVILKQNRLPLKKYLTYIFAILILFFGFYKIDRVVFDDFMTDDTPYVAPLFMIPAITDYMIMQKRSVDINKQNISSEYQLNSDSNDTIVVFVLGESARGDRFGINGYYKDTTPNFTNNENLVSFKNASSCDTSTLNSIPCLLTRDTHDEYDNIIRENSFVEIYKDLGYETYWFSRNSDQKRIKNFCQEAAVCKYEHDLDYDEDLLPQLSEILKNQNNKLIVLHTLGSHIDYNERVPQKYQIFKPLCDVGVSSCEKEKLDNSYDNTIYYTDIFLTKIMDILKDKKACIIYTSDHGESLGEKSLGIVKRFGHSTPYNVAPKEQTTVPFILWFSDKYLRSKSLDLKKMRKLEDISHDNIFDTVLGCGYISKIKGKTLNICDK